MVMFRPYSRWPQKQDYFPFCFCWRNGKCDGACLAKGTTQLVNAAREPEIVDLATCLSTMGARISGAGSDVITIEGVSSLGPARHAVVADRVEAGSYAIAVAMTCGVLCIKQMIPMHLESFFDVMRHAGVNIETSKDEVRINTGSVLRR